MSAPRLEIQTSPGLWNWLAEHNVSLALTTYQSNRLILIGRSAEGERLALQERLFDKPMGLCLHEDRLTLSTRYQLWELANRLPPGHTHEGGDRLYVPSRSWITGDLNVHELAIDRNGRLLFVNTDFSCLATLDPEHSFAPLWRPPFIKTLVAEDRCHLNGLALQDGVPTWMSACSRTDTAAGWRHHRHDGGIVLNIPENAIVATGLSMPHSPRWYRERLWLLNSGSGELGYLDGERFVPVAYGPGFARGLDFVGDFALIGLSQLRSASFGGLALERRLAADGRQAQCGLLVVDLNTGAVVHWLRFATLIEELFDLIVLPGIRQPRALGLQDDAIERLVSFPGSDGLVITKPTAARPARGPAAPVAGLPRLDPNTVKYQRVYHLTPENLKRYDALTTPRLSQRWASQPQRGELIGLSAALDGTMIGFAVAEQWQTPDGELRAELLSLHVSSIYRRLGIAERLRHELQRVTAAPLALSPPPDDQPSPEEIAP
ncbi:Conserved hypothetical protein CHP03032 [Thiorhodococcus drewsii AZ1]|uniref:Uncharacterized protein n=1 Tax=Thiorhodococcus drewsii AZ1 TaxID=765913 RepID=G2DXG8_9GAMM|nr:TIGR03032 family protein [Thiorhodococcus drewsii]EGV33017.1 Conserved hypothetical protein CHP03032 [Thiorhodococcus drewsii AZ1]